MGGERAVLGLSLAQALADAYGLADVLGDEQRAGRLACPVRQRCERDRREELGPVLAAVEHPRVVDPPALPDRLHEVRRRPVAAVLGGQERERAAFDLVGGVAVHRLAAGAPGDDRPLGVDADDRLGGGIPNRRQLGREPPAFFGSRRQAASPASPPRRRPPARPGGRAERAPTRPRRRRSGVSSRRPRRPGRPTSRRRLPRGRRRARRARRLQPDRGHPGSETAGWPPAPELLRGGGCLLCGRGTYVGASCLPGPQRRLRAVVKHAARSLANRIRGRCRLFLRLPDAGGVAAGFSAPGCARPCRG